MIIADAVTAGFIVGILTLMVFALIGLVVAGFLASVDVKSSWITTGLVLYLLLCGGVWLIATWPLNYDYHHWVNKEGKVTRISNRLVSGGEGIVNQRFVVQVGATQYGIDDTRAATLKVGDHVRLRCKKEHQFQQPLESDGWACRWGGVTA